MASKSCKKVNPLLENLRKDVKELCSQLEGETLVYADFLTQLENLKLSYLGLGGRVSEQEFNSVLKSFDINDIITGKKNEVKEKQSQLSSLDFSKITEIYRNATHVMGYMKHDFSVRMFKCLFVDNTDYGSATTTNGKLVNDTVRRIPITTLDININIAKMKNSLLQLLIDELHIEGISSSVFNPIAKTVNVSAYKTIMNAGDVWLSRAKDQLPTADERTKKIHSALFILNNFDSLTQEYLAKILSIKAENKGNLDNFEYVKEFEGNAPSIWSVDDLMTYGSDLYASNLGKFILSTIQKVDANLNPIEGTYMSSQDAFVLASLLKEAEYEYHILKRNSPDYNPNLSFRTNLKQAVQVLLELGINDELESLKKFKKEIYPVYNFLYGADKVAYRNIFTNTLRTQKNVNITGLLNLEDVLTAEIVKNCAPVYLEYSTFDKCKKLDNGLAAPLRLIAVAHTFKGTSYITQMLKQRVFDELLVSYDDRDMLLRGQWPTSVMDDFQTIEDVLGDESNIATAFRNTFKLLFGEELTPEFVASIPASDTNKLKVIVEPVQYICQLFLGVSKRIIDPEEQIETFNSEVDKWLLSKNAMDSAKRYSNLAQTIADRKVDLPITIIKNAEGKSIPIYRLNSTIFDDVYLINRLKTQRLNRNQLNILCGNLHLLSKYNDPQDPANTNAMYLGSTGLRLETISKNLVNAANNSSAQESYINSVLGDFISAGASESGHSISVQLMTLSDKASILTKIVNLDAIIKGYGNKEVNKSLDSMSNEELTDIYYFYRKNQVVDKVFHIIDTWNKLLNLNLEKAPDINAELMNTESSVLSNTSKFIEKSWKTINKALIDQNLQSPEAIEAKIREYNSVHPDNPIYLTKELHYSKYSGVFGLNKLIYAHYTQIKTLDTFSNKISNYIQSNLESTWIQALNDVIKENTDAGALVASYASAHNLYFDPQSGLSEELLRRRLLLDNFLRTQLLELHFKGSYLDVIKSVKNYDETDPSNEDLSIIEADARFKAAGKRTVDLPGTGENYAQGLIDGVSEDLIVAHVEEPKEATFSPVGIEDDVEILNGSGRISPIYAHQESASMPGAPFRGINRKSLGEHVDDYYSTLYKWAEYLINNWHIRNSQRSKYKLDHLFEKMHNILFDEDIDLTKSFLNPNAKYTPEKANDGKHVYFSRGLHYYQLIDLIKVGGVSNTYNIVLKEVDKYGNELMELEFPENLIQTQNISINTLYDLYKVLGGMECLEIKEAGEELTYSDSNLRMLYNYVTNIGEIVNPESDKFDQESVRQPLRSKFVSIVASDSGLKRGVTNLNSKDVYTDKTKSLLTSKIKSALFKSQMDVYHSISDDTVATEPTQTLAALSTNGTSVEEANRVYKAIATIIKNNVNTTLNKLEKSVQEDDLDETVKILSKEIIDKINEGGSDLQNSIVDLCKLFLDGIIPVSDPIFFNQFHTWNIIELNQLALRRKYPGMGCILNPSSNTYQLFTVGGVELVKNGRYVNMSKDLELEYDDLVKRARNVFDDFYPILTSFSTDNLASLYLYSKTTEGRTAVWELLNSADLSKPETVDPVIVQLLNIANTINQNMSVDDGEIDLTIKDKCGRLIQQGSVEPLDTIFYSKRGQWYKLTLDSADKFFNFVMDPEVQEVFLDITTPHDLKPQIIKYSYDGSEHSLHDSAAGTLSFLFQQMDYADINTYQAVGQEDGLSAKLQCKF